MNKVVIIDDEPRIRQGIIRCIPWESMGTELAGEASNGVEALELIRSARPDLVITDIRMPDMDGLDLISIVRREGIPSKFIIISGFAEFEYAQRALRYGVVDYILKPVEEDKLLKSIANCLDARRAAAQSGDQGIPLTNGNKHHLVRKVLRILDNEYMNELTLVNVAERLGVHPNYLSSLFSKSEGESFSNYLLRVRMEKASELIMVSNMKVYEISERVGYRDYRWFSKLYKQFYGVTPMECRRGSAEPDAGENEAGKD